MQVTKQSLDRLYPFLGLSHENVSAPFTPNKLPPKKG